MSETGQYGSIPASIDESRIVRATPGSAALLLPVRRLGRPPVWKRVLDITVIVLLSQLLLPVMLVLAILVKCTSKGTIFFRQERIGLDQRPFTLLKFRTMIAGNDTSVHSTYVDDLIASDKPMTKLDVLGDSRLIPLARWIRVLGLDELPQLINVIRGEMSLVGPRPCLASEAKRYSNEQRERFQAQPGLTGLWQVSGKNRLTFSEMVELDIKYVRTSSLALDLKILLKTIPALVKEVRHIKTRPPGEAP